MHFYGLVFHQTWAIAVDWLQSFSLGSKLVLAVISAIAANINNVLRKQATVAHILWGAVNAILGILAFIGLIFAITLVVYAPTALLQSIASKATTDTTAQQTKIRGEQIADLDKAVTLRIAACAALFKPFEQVATDLPSPISDLAFARDRFLKARQQTIEIAAQSKSGLRTSQSMDVQTAYGEQHGLYDEYRQELGRAQPLIDACDKL